MRNLLVYIFISHIPIIGLCQSWNWANGYGEIATDEIQSIITDGFGNIYATGKYADTFVIGFDTLQYLNGTEVFVAKFDSTGNPIWARGYPSPGTNQSFGIALDGFGNSYITGQVGSLLNVDTFSLSNEAFIIKHDFDGNVIWAKGLDHGAGFGITSITDTSFYITGRCTQCTFDTISFPSSGSEDAFLAKMDTAGLFEWVRRPVGGNSEQAGLSVSADNDGNALLTGRCFNQIGFPDDTIEITGGQEQLFVAKYDGNGDYKWAHGSLGPDKSIGSSIAADAYGNAFIGGYFADTLYFLDDTIYYNNGASSFLIIKLSSDGNLEWHAVGGGNTIDECRSISVDNSGNIYASGRGYSNGAVYDTINVATVQKVCMVKYTGLGNALWVMTTPGGNPHFFSHHIYANKATLGGTHSLTTTFGSQTVPNTGGTFGDLLLAQLSIPDCPTIIPNFSISCLSDTTVELTADTGYVNYKWSDNQFGQSIEVATGGSYYLVVKDTAGCTGTAAPQSVDVSPAPLITVLDSFEFCVGGSATLLMDSSFVSYIWSTGDTTNAVTISASDTVSVTVTDALGCAKVSENVVIIEHDPQPVILASMLEICEGDSSTFSTSETYDGYQWTGGFNTDSIVVNTAGVYGVTVSEGPGCTASATAVTVNLTDSTIVIQGDGPLEFCEGDEVTLSTNVGGVSQYNWSSGATTSSLTVSQSSSITLFVAYSNGCEATSNELLIVVFPNPTAPEITKSFDTLKVAGTFTQYQWYLNGGLISGATSSTHVALTSGSYTVVVSDENECQATSEAFEHAVGISGVKNALSFKVYPNPSDGVYFVEFNNLETGKEIRLLVTDPIGRVVLDEKRIEASSLEFSLAKQPKGVYNLQVQNGDTIQNAVLIKG